MHRSSIVRESTGRTVVRFWGSAAITLFAVTLVASASLEAGFAPAVSYAAGQSSQSVTVGDFNRDGKQDLAVANYSSNDVSILLGNADGSFLPAVNYSVGNTPLFVAVGDFNRDGAADLAVANSASNTISILAGIGNGTFQTATNIGAGTKPISLAVGDLNGDGKLDLVVANDGYQGSNNVSVLLGNGNGTFQGAVAYAAGTWPVSIAIADLNGDGKRDLAVANYNSSDVSILVGNGNGSFQPAVSYGAGTNPESVAVGDFNQDDKFDLVVANNTSNDVSVLLGDGDGTFGNAVNFEAGANPRSVVVGDFDGDGNQDLAVANPTADGSVSVLVGSEDGAFGVPATYSVGTIPNSVAVDDFNGDGKLDLVVANNGSNDVSVLLNNGAATVCACQAAPSYGGSAGWLAVGDLNGDGKEDLVIPGQPNSVTALMGNADGTLGVAGTFGTLALPSSAAIGDFDGDGRADLAVTVASGTAINIAILLGNGDGTFKAAVGYIGGSTPDSIVVGDFNGDGRRDLAVVNAGAASVSILLGNGNGTFQVPVSFAAGANPVDIAVGDFNRDGKQDLAVINKLEVSNNVSILLGNGTGTFQPPAGYRAGSLPLSVAVGDFNEDGEEDLAVANGYSNNVSILLGRGDGTFNPALNHVLGTAANSGCVSVAAGDFDGNSVPDLAVVTSGEISTYDVAVLLSNGDGSFRDAGHFVAGVQPRFVVVGEFNGDGKADLAVANVNDVSVLLGGGGGSFRTPVNYEAPPSPSAVAVGDFDRDGKPDLAVANNGPGGVTTLRGNGDGTYQKAVSHTTGVGFLHLGIADFNADGRQDLAVAGSGTVSTLLGNGDGTFAAPMDYGLTHASFFVIGDFNRDGKKDLAVAIYYMNSVAVLAGNGDGSFQAAVSIAAGSGVVFVASGDFNRDGKEDLATVNRASNNVSVLLANGDGTFQAAVNYPVGTGPESAAIADFNRDGKLDVAVANYESNNVSIRLGNGDGTFPTLLTYEAGTHPQAVAAVDFDGDGKLDVIVTNYSSDNVSVLPGNGDGTFKAPVNYATGMRPVSVAVQDLNRDGKADLAVANVVSNNVSILINRCHFTTSTALSSLANPSVFGQTTTFMAVVSTGTGVGEATGTVTFRDGATVLGAGALSGGSATLATATLSVGVHSITAAYGGSDTLAASSSAPAIQTVVPAQADLSITTTDSQATAVPGSPVTYVVLVSNAGPHTAVGVGVVAVAVPAVVSGVSWSCVGVAGGSCTPSGLGPLSDVVTLPAGGAVVYNLTGTISASATGSLSNTATVSPGNGVSDPNLTNNSSTDTDTLTPRADLSVTKTDGKASALAGQSTTYTIVAENGGPSAASGIAVTDAVPAAITGAAWMCVGSGGGSCTASGSGSINDTVNLPVGGSVTYTLSGTLSVSATGSVSNTASVSPPAGVTDPNPANNSATDTDTIPPSISISDAVLEEPYSGTLAASFLVSLSLAAEQAITVDFATAGGTAVAGVDFEPASGTLTFAPGTVQQVATVPVLGDTLAEETETFYVYLSNPVNATLARSQAVGTILDKPITFSIGDVSVTEGNEGTRDAVFPVTLSTAVGQDSSVSFETADGTAAAGSDYTALSGTLTFAAGEIAKTIVVPVIGDRVGEPDETFFVTLTNPSGAVLSQSQGLGTIETDDNLVDFNADGQSDILWHHQATGELYTWMLQGTVTTAGSYLTPKSFSDTNWQIRGLADFDRNGSVDVLWHHQVSGDLYVWQLNGTVTVAGSYLTPKSFSDTRWQIRAVTDLDGDRQPDILWHHQITGDLYVWFMNGVIVKGGSYLTPKSFADTHWQIRGASDFNGDGQPDLLWHHQVTGDLYVWYLAGTVTTSGSYLTPKSFADTRWQIRRVVDMNGDDKPDVLWHHQVTGDLYVWFLDGTVTTSGSYLTPKSFTDTRWQIVPR